MSSSESEWKSHLKNLLLFEDPCLGYRCITIYSNVTGNLSGRLKSLVSLIQARFDHRLLSCPLDTLAHGDALPGCPFSPALAGLDKWDSVAKRRSERSERSILSC